MTDKTKAVLAYIFTLIGGLIFLFSKDSSKEVKFHAAQATVIGIGYFAIQFVYAIIPLRILFFSSLLWLVYIAAVIIGIVKVSNEEDPEIPVIGNLAKSIFGKQIDE